MIEDEVVLEALGLRREYGSVIAVRDLDLAMAAGEFLTIFGPNGARGRPHRSPEHAEERGLAGSVRAEKAQDLVPAYREGHAVQGACRSVGLRDALNFNHCNTL